jgi:hypothetical protein
MLVSWPIFIFPVFVIIFLLTRPTFASQNLGGQASKSDTREISYIAVTAIVFDFFSGYTFGFSTLAILIIDLAIFFFKTRLNVNPRALFSLAVYTLIFVFLYFILLSIQSNSRIIIDQAVIIVTETLILFLIFVRIFRKFVKG